MIVLSFDKIDLVFLLLFCVEMKLLEEDSCYLLLDMEYHELVCLKNTSYCIIICILKLDYYITG